MEPQVGVRVWASSCGSGGPKFGVRGLGSRVGIMGFQEQQLGFRRTEQLLGWNVGYLTIIENELETRGCTRWCNSCPGCWTGIGMGRLNPKHV